MRVLMSEKAASCAASVRPAGPQPTMRTSTSSGSEIRRSEVVCLGRLRDFRIAGVETVEMELHALLTRCRRLATANKRA